MIYPDIDEFTPWLEPVDFIYTPSHQIDLTGKLQTCTKYEIYLGSNKYDSSKNELLSISDAALLSFYHLSLTDTKFVLPQSSSTQSDAAFSRIVEGPPHVIEIPVSMVSESWNTLRKRAKLFGCVHLASRFISKFKG
uniref:Uncharacterized protein n=1 Tax=Panagrolaimus sp. PS1159 TaxID=55785 RepID=A0AC35FEI7_9BILA